jgi:hypothetical protein
MAGERTGTRAWVPDARGERAIGSAGAGESATGRQGAGAYGWGHGRAGPARQRHRASEGAGTRTNGRARPARR